MPVVRACGYVAKAAIAGQTHGVVIIQLGVDGRAGSVIEAGNVKSHPYAAMEAAQRVADRFSWR